MECPREFNERIGGWVNGILEILSFVRIEKIIAKLDDPCNVAVLQAKFLAGACHICDGFAGDPTPLACYNIFFKAAPNAY